MESKTALLSCSGHCGGDAKHRWDVSPPAMHVLTQGSENDLNGEVSLTLCANPLLFPLPCLYVRFIPSSGEL